jgi:hypothetical protein
MAPARPTPTPRRDRRTARRVTAMMAAASALVTAVQVATADPARACYQYGSDCIEEVVVTPPYDPGGDPRDYPSSGNGGGGGGGGGVYGGSDPACYDDLGVCIENITVSARNPNPFGIGEVT